MNKQLLMIFIKNPKLGKVKTRLAATIGDKEALGIYNQLLKHTRDISLELPYDKAVFYSDFIDTDDGWHPSIYNKFVQEGKDLGQRMLNAFKQGFEAGYESICIIGSDCFELTADMINKAFSELKRHEIVIGPSMDGGYYLLGMNKLHEVLFVDKDWSTQTVMMDTVKDIEKNKLHAKLLGVLSDVDKEEDLKTMKSVL